MSVELFPTELGFSRPLTHEVTQVLKIRNIDNSPIVFKVKTTAPRQYCVRPNSGRLEAGKEVKVQVLLQAMAQDPPLDSKCRDKFLVQSAALTGKGQDITNMTELWNHIDQYAKSTIVEKKIRVVYLSSDQAPSTPNAKALNGSVDDSDHALAATPAWSSSAATNGESPPRYSEHDDATPPEQPEPSVIPSASTIKSAVANVIPISTEDLQAQLTEAKATISRLVQQADQGLRQRKGASDIQEGSSAGLKTTTLSPSQTTPIGVPVQIVAGLCLLSFLLAYFLF